MTEKWTFGEGNRQVKTAGAVEYTATDEAMRHAVDVLNGIARFVKNCGWTQGLRNSMAVDFAIAAWVLDEDPEKLFDVVVTPYADRPDAELRGAYLLDAARGEDDGFDFPTERMDRVIRYVPRWFGAATAIVELDEDADGDPWVCLLNRYGIDTGYYAVYAKLAEKAGDDLPFALEIGTEEESSSKNNEKSE